jgi:hypothetical protein
MSGGGVKRLGDDGSDGEAGGVGDDEIVGEGGVD